MLGGDKNLVLTDNKELHSCQVHGLHTWNADELFSRDRSELVWQLCKYSQLLHCKPFMSKEPSKSFRLWISIIDKFGREKRIITNLPCFCELGQCTQAVTALYSANNYGHMLCDYHNIRCNTIAPPAFIVDYSDCYNIDISNTPGASINDDHANKWTADTQWGFQLCRNANHAYGIIAMTEPYPVLGPVSVCMMGVIKCFRIQL
jgi:hypothetical protein